MALKSVSFKKTRGKHVACFKQAFYCVTVKQMEDHKQKKNALQLLFEKLLKESEKDMIILEKM